MTLLKQSPSKNLRSKASNGKNVLQICTFIVVCIWLLHQVKHSYDKHHDGSPTITQIDSENESMNFGRTDLHSQIQKTGMDRPQEKDGELHVEFEDMDRMVAEKNKTEENEEDEEGRGDDVETDGQDQEKSEEEDPEEVEDTIDEADRDKEDETEEQESEGTGNRIEDESVNQTQARGENYEGDDASSAVVHNYHATSTEFALRGLRSVKEVLVANADSVQDQYAISNGVLKFLQAQSAERNESSERSAQTKLSEPEWTLNIDATTTSTVNEKSTHSHN